MAWTAPRTWIAGEVVSAALMNTHVRDNLLEVGPSNTGSAWSTWSPTLSNLTVTASTARYKQIGKTVHFVYSGTINTVTAGLLSVSLPVPQNTAMNSLTIGTATAVDNGGSIFTGSCSIDPATNNIFGYGAAGIGAGASWAAGTSIPIAWSAADIIRFTGCYEAA